MKSWSGSTRVPVEVVFGGCHPDQKTVDLCLEEARAISAHSRRIESCDVFVTQRGEETEIRIDARTAEGEVLVDRVLSASSSTQLRLALRNAFAELARGMDRARGPGAASATTVSRPPAEVTPPPCVWHG